jgi:putative tryptophan/tyrosine transport system substrate-binding protein
VRRREFIALVAVAGAWPLATRAQRAGVPVVGYLSITSAATATYFVGFRDGLKDAGYVEGQNLAIEYRWAEGQYDRLPILAAELVRRPVAVIVAGGIPAVFAVKAATSTIPVVFNAAGDPVRLGIVSSFNRPGGNITGVSFLGAEPVAKRLELLLEVVPKASVIGVLENPANPRADLDIAEVQAAARTMGKEIVIAKATSERDFDAAFAMLVQRRVGALLVPSDSLFFVQREELIKLVAQHALPAIYDIREFASAGGLLSYGPSFTDDYRLIAGQVVEILKGAKPADMPVLQPTKFELVINLKTAKALGLTIPQSILLRADEVIE